MKSALVEPGGRIAQIVAPGAEFEIHAGLSWVSVPNSTTVRDRWDGGQVVKEVVQPEPTGSEIYDRALAGNPVLAALIDAINSGDVGGAGQGKTAGALKATIAGRL